MTNLEFPTPAAPGVAPGLAERTKGAAQDTATMLWRDTIRTIRQPEMLVFAVVMGSFFLVLFNYVFGGAIGAGADVDYLQFLVPACLSSPLCRAPNRPAWASPPTSPRGSPTGSDLYR